MSTAVETKKGKSSAFPHDLTSDSLRLFEKGGSLRFELSTLANDLVKMSDTEPRLSYGNNARNNKELNSMKNHQKGVFISH
jgi:hypothetical protein